MSADVFTESEVSLFGRIEPLRDFAVPQTNITFAAFGHHVVAVDPVVGKSSGTPRRVGERKLQQK